MKLLKRVLPDSLYKTDEAAKVTICSASNPDCHPLTAAQYGLLIGFSVAVPLLVPLVLTVYLCVGICKSKYDVYALAAPTLLPGLSAEPMLTSLPSGPEVDVTDIRNTTLGNTVRCGKCGAENKINNTVLVMHCVVCKGGIER